MKKALKKIQNETGIIEPQEHKVCPHCDGNREEPGVPEQDEGTPLCTECNGSGKVAADYDPEEPETEGWTVIRNPNRNNPDPYAILDENHNRIADVSAYKPGAKDRAYLMAAAPDMLQELHRVVMYLTCPQGPTPADLKYLLQGVRAAISKSKP